SRRGSRRHRYLLSRSMAALAASGVDDIRYALLVTIRRCRCFMLHGCAVVAEGAINSAASQSSSAGCDGGRPLRPKSDTVGTIAWPKWRIQIWLTATRAVSGLCVSAIHRARASRRPELSAGYDFTGRFV